MEPHRLFLLSKNFVFALRSPSSIAKMAKKWSLQCTDPDPEKGLTNEANQFEVRFGPRPPRQSYCGEDSCINALCSSKL